MSQTYTYQNIAKLLTHSSISILFWKKKVNFFDEWFDYNKTSSEENKTKQNKTKYKTKKQKQKQKRIKERYRNKIEND